MNTVQELKQQLEELSTKIDSLRTQEFTFTKDELIDFVRKITEQAQEYTINSISEMDFDGDKITELDYDTYQNNITIEVSINEDELIRSIQNQIEDMSLDTDDVVTTMTSVYNQIKTQQ
jgi:N-methylhydantoinase B/oxoprolinase/acetone carboxylase alpha subunit